MYEVTVHPRAAQSLRTIAGTEAGRRYEQRLADARRILDGHSVWQINSTSEGGGVAELLRSCLGYLLDDGIDTRWAVIEGDPEFFRITKRIHNRLHGVLGDGGPLGGAERRRYFVRGGFAEVGPQGLTVLAETAIDLVELERSVLDQAIKDAEEDIADAKDEGVRDRAKTQLDHLRQVQTTLSL